MPYCPLSVTSDLSKKQIIELSSKLQEALVEIAKKPPTSVMVHIIPNCHLFLNQEGNAAYFEINAVGLHDEVLIEKLGVKFLDIISSIAEIPYDRIFVQFNISEPKNWILRGHSLSYWKQKWASEGKKGFSE